MAFHGCLGAQETDYLSPLIEYRPTIDLEPGNALNEIDLHLTDVDLIKNSLGI